jgi:hypothetical protein
VTTRKTKLLAGAPGRRSVSGGAFASDVESSRLRRPRSLRVAGHVNTACGPGDAGTDAAPIVLAKQRGVPESRDSVGASAMSLPTDRTSIMITSR